MRNSVLKTLVIIVAISVLFPLRDARGFFVDGNVLVGYMREYEKFMREDTTAQDVFVVSFQGYVTGVFDATWFFYDIPSADITIKHVCDIVADYLKLHPEKWHQPASNLVIEALEQAFPRKE